VVYSAKTGNFEPAFTATVLKYPSKIGDIELRAGYAMESEPIGAICFKVGDLTKYGFVQPLHNILNVSAGPYVGYDFQTEEWDYGALVTIINLQF
ncbi:MAG: hypothetical protein HQ579_07530, partial [Candidatus Omnitrophica bacterium]|nr:hypothetical protein [Candidatus Omnitrophota bacterium]